MLSQNILPNCPHFLLLSVRVKTAVYQGYGYVNLRDVQISGHIHIEFC